MKLSNRMLPILLLMTQQEGGEKGCDFCLNHRVDLYSRHNHNGRAERRQLNTTDCVKMNRELFVTLITQKHPPLISAVQSRYLSFCYNIVHNGGHREKTTFNFLFNRWSRQWRIPVSLIESLFSKIAIEIARVTQTFQRN